MDSYIGSNDRLGANAGLLAFERSAFAGAQLTRRRVNHIDRLYFLHIPKTAGTSVRSWLQELFPHDEVLDAHHLHELDALDDEAIRTGRFASGHFGWRYVERAQRAGLNIQTVTYLRDSVALTTSALRYARHFSEEQIAAFKGGAANIASSREIFRAQSLSDAIKIALRPEIAPYWVNSMVRYISGAGNQAADLQALSASNLTLARERLKDMRFFGLMESMDWSTVLFCDAFALPFLSLQSNYNLGPTSGDGHLSLALVDKFRQLHAFDDELLRFARTLFHDRIQELLRRHSLPADAKPDDLAAPLMRQFLHTEHNVEAISNAQISLGDGVICPGFQSRFYWQPAQCWVRWAGTSRRSTVCLPLDRSQPLTLEFDFIAFLADDIRDELRIETGGVHLPMTRHYEQQPDGSYRVVGQVEVPPDATVATYTALDFIVPRTTSSPGLPKPSSFALSDIRVATSSSSR